MTTLFSTGVHETRAHRLIRFLTYCVLAIIVFRVFIRDPGLNLQSGTIFTDMIHGTAHKPFVYRALLPAAVRLLTAAVPDTARRLIEEWAATSPVGSAVLSELRGQPEFFLEYVIGSVLMYLSLLGFAFAVRYLFAAVYGASGLFKDSIPLAALLCLPPFFTYHSYIYDFPALFLFTLGLALMVRQRWPSFVLVFLLACVNKETAILLTMVFCIHFRNRSAVGSRLFRTLLVLQLCIFLVTKALLAFIFMDNPGRFVEFHLMDHNVWLFRAYPLSSVLVAGAVGGLVFHKWREKPTFLKDGLWIIVPLVILGALFGQLDELRIFYEAYPIALLLASYTVGSIFGIDVRNLERRPSSGPVGPVLH